MHSEETKEKIRRAKLWHITSDEARKKMSEAKKWRSRTKEHREKISLWMKCTWRIYWHTEEWKKEMSIKMKWRPSPNKWKKFWIQARENMRQAQLGKKHKPHSKETKEKISLSLIGKQRWRGELCHNWKWWLTNKNRLERNRTENLCRIRAVFKRDDFTCRKCRKRWCKLEAHHIENFSSNIWKRFDIENWVALCKNCHRKFHRIYGIKNNSKTQLESFILLSI